MSPTITFGQTKEVSDERMSQIGKTLSVSPEKSKAIIEALDYKKELIMQTLKDNKLKPIDKRKMLEVIIKERQQKLNKLLTPEQVSKLQSDASPNTKKYYEDIQIKQSRFFEDAKTKTRGGKLKRVVKRNDSYTRS
ncbi:hypothetical protein FBD94_15405 [Pedobacter hiemivivus]|uniref:Uncharacterized protein n=1 Tax=Pedobacter hiemivivus TaxID=2530454 RepID=A0A4U1GBK2_9SPHI|nr:hypothetical protein [Pedobacter hiemivivus]TKC60290.1 hypothetical protein FBD94_15405 [Pedobacter hiemivivus]